VQQVIEEEHDTQGFSGRFGPGLPRISDGSTLFLLHMLSKMKPVKDGGSPLAIVFNGSPLFSGDAGSGESEIRRWVIENDWLEAIVGLPDQLFYNTGISTYIWVITNRKPKARKGKVQLINGVDQTTIALNLVTAHGRATPLIWKTVVKSALKDNRNEFEDEVIRRLHEVLAKRCAGDPSR